VFRVRTVAVPPGAVRPYDETEWQDALVLVKAGAIELDCRDGGSRRFEAGESLWLAGLPLRALRNSGSEPAVLVAFSRLGCAPVRAAVLTISTTLARGEGEDKSGPALVGLCEAAGLEVVHETVSDDREAIGHALARHADEGGARFIFTTGGTGMTTDDVTPEATRDVIDRDAPGYAESIRQEARKYTPLGILTRGISGIRGRTLIINFPGSPKAIGQSWPVVEPTLKHAAATLERD
jgi:molybdenum cofactor synthesis domain-containing protein